MRIQMRSCLVMLFLALPFTTVCADDYQDTIDIFKNAGESGVFFDKSYGFAVFPTVGKVGFVVGGAGGDGRVFVGDEHMGNSTMTQLSVGFQAGGKAYSQIVFFQDERAFKEFTGGNFEFGAEAQAVAITAGASARATTAGSSAGASGGQHDAATTGKFNKGLAVFTVAKGGLMFEASIAGQKFSYRAK